MKSKFAMTSIRKGRTFRLREKFKIKKSSMLDVTDNNDNYELLKWMSQRGFKHKSKIKVHIFQDTGRGLLACKTIRANQTIISIPSSLMITRSVIQNNNFYSKFLASRSINYFNEVELLALFVACESLRGQESEWWNYLKTLPKRQITISNLSEEQLIFLPKTYSKLVREEINNIRNFFLKAKLFIDYAEKQGNSLIGKLAFETFHWSWNIVNSRCVSLIGQNSNSVQSDKSHPSKNTVALMPFLDLLNHSTEAKVSTSICKVTNSFEIITLKSVKKGSEVFINYGSHGNRKLLLHYGFIVPQNSNNAISFSIEDLQFVNNCHSKCANLKLNYARENLKNWNVTKEGLSWSLKVAIQFLSSSFCFLRFSNPSQALYKLYSSSVANIEDQLPITEVFRQTAYELVTRKILETNQTVSNFANNSESEPITDALSQLLEEEICLLINVQKCYEKRLKL